MRTKTLRNGRIVPAIWQGGSLGVSEIEFHKRVRQRAVFHDGIMFGCNAIDTAENYGNGLSETIIGEILQSKYIAREEVLIASKVSPEHCGIHDIIHACEGSLRRLQTEYIDLYQIHWYNPIIVLEETMNAMDKLKRQGKIKHIGVCNFTVDQIAHANDILNGNLDTVQCEYNLKNRNVEKYILPYCEENNILLLAYTPLSKGTISHPLLMEIAKKYHATPEQIILNWLTWRNSVSAIPYTSNYNHMIANAQSTEFDLEEDDYHIIGNEFDNPTVFLKPSQITCEGATSGVANAYPAYQTIEEAKENRYKLFPSPQDIASEVNETMTLSKPIYVKSIGKGKYQLIGGSVRYWGWVLTFGMDEDIECIVERDK